MQQYMLHRLQEKHRLIIQLLLLIVLILSHQNATQVYRSCRRLPRSTGWLNIVWHQYSDARFKKLFRVSRATFQFILSRIEHDLERETVTEEPISTAFRLAICLYRLGRGDYYFTIAEMTGLGVSTVCGVVSEVCGAIVDNLWKDCVQQHFPTSEAQYKEKVLDMEQLWQFPYAWGAIDGCHLPLKCPAGGAESRKEYHNFKNFYSIVLMAIVDAKYRFIWASCGFPGNSHDSIIFQSTELGEDITQREIIPNLGRNVNGVNVSPVILGDSAFPCRTWLLKPFTNAVLTPQQRYFNYRLSRGRMVTEGAYGQLKGRWRILLRKCESRPDGVRLASLACIVLHNVCLDRGDTISQKLDLTRDPSTGELRDRATIRRLLQMRNCPKIRDTCPQATRIRNALVEKFWREQEGHGVC